MDDDTAGSPLSAGQRQLWLLQRLEPDSAAYNILYALRVDGPLRVDRLRAALGAVLDRHDVLRTSFPERGGDPVQVVAPPGGHELPVIDLSGQPDAARGEALDRLLAEETRKPFVLTTGPVLRATLVRMAVEEHVLLLSVHHIAFDGGSGERFFAELAACYAGRAAELPAPGTQYADHAARQARHGHDADLEFWRDRLAGAPPLSLPVDRPPTSVRGGAGASFRFGLGGDLSPRVTEFADERKTTPFLVLLSAFQVMLARYTGASDIVVATPVSTRDSAELDGIIGYFVNTLALRVRLPVDGTVGELLDHVNDVFFDSLDHASVPFDEVVRALVAERAGNRTPLTQVCFNAVDERHLGRPELPGLRVEALDVERTVTKFDLDLDVVLTGSELYCVVEYSTDLFDAATVRRMVESWRQVVQAFVAGPDTPLADIDPLTPAEHERILRTWNDTGTIDPDPRRIHELFEAQVDRTPDATAVVFGEDRLSYAELDRRANQLAHALRARGVGLESVVGICLPRSADLIVTSFAVLKAGGVVVPLDPELPPGRLAYMLADAEATALITLSGLADALPPGAGATCLLLDRDEAEHATMPVGRPRVPGGQDNLAWLIYTSGSTGAPKCAMLSHGNFTSYFHAFEHAYHLRETVRVVLQMAAFSFDIFIADTMRSLFVGATLVVCPREVLLSPPDLYALMVRTGVNFAEFVPPMLKVLLDHVEETAQTLEFLDLLAAGGDSWYATDYRRAQRLCSPATRLVDTYGTTETGIDNITFTGELPAAAGDVVPIGRPLANSRLYVLDQAMRPVPVGVVGELYLGGYAVGRGYAGRPALTAERFVPDPFGVRPGDRLYRTGDLGRWLPDGTAEIIGRADSQVKIRGFRVELGEIEAALRHHPQVDQGVVVVRERERGDRALAAFVTPAVPDIDVADLREHLRARLPKYMVPAAVVVLDHIPLNGNGKLDRAALPPVAWDDQSSSAGQVPPATPEEEVLAGIVADVLGLRGVGVTDDFFELGGHSLLATRVVSKVRAALGAELPLMRIFDHPTVREMARCLASPGTGTPAPGPITFAGRPDAGLPLSFAQQRLWFVEQFDPGGSAYNVPIVFTLRGPLDVDALRLAIGAVIERHESLRTVFRAETGVPRQVVLPPAEPEVRFAEIADALWAERLVEEECRRPFELAEGPLVRSAVIRRAAEEHLLVVTMHHIVTDGWSTPIFLEELSACYAAALSGTGATLPELPVQYADFAVWQRNRLDETTAEHLAYWRDHLDGAPDLVELPLDRARTNRPNDRGDRLEFTVDQAGLAEVERFGRRAGATLFMTLLAGFQVLLARYSGQRDIVVGTAIANRTHPATENLIGFFVNTLPLRLDLSDDPAFRTAVERVRHAALSAYAHQDLPFEHLVERLCPQRDPSYQPLVQVLFTVQNTEEEVLRLPGITATEVPVAVGTTKFDLTVEVTPSDAGLTCALWYRTELFDAATIEQLAGDWRALLLAAVAAPETPVGSLPVPPRAVRPPVRSGVPVAADDSAGTGTDAADPTAVRRVLAAVWSEVLRTPVTDVTANFFTLGGHSLLAAEVVARVDELMGVRLPVRALFQNATIELLARHLAPLVATDRVIGQATVDGLADREPDAPDARPRTGLFPTTSGQEGLWFIDRLEPDSVQYSIPLAFRLRGELSTDALAAAVNRVVERHESLRTTFAEEDGKPRQQVHPPRVMDLPVTDLCELPPAEREAELARLLDEAELTVFDLATGPLFTARLIRVAPTDHVLVLGAHHIVFDGWSLNVVLNELAEDYRAAVAGGPDRRTAPEFQLADYAIGQRDWLGGAEYRAQLDYWRAELADLPEVLDLTPGRTRPTVRDSAGAWHPLELDEQLTTRVRELCAQEQITVFMYLMTVFSLVLARWSGRAEVAVGATVANRRSVREQALVGYLANTVVIRTDLSGNPTHRALLRRVREVALRAYAHQELPFDHVVAALRPRRRLDSTPIFQAMLAFQDNTARDPSWAGVTVEELTRTTPTCMFDLTLVLNAEGGRVTGALNYRTDLFDASEIRRLAEDFLAAARNVVAAPERRLVTPQHHEQEVRSR